MNTAPEALRLQVRTMSWESDGVVSLRLTTPTGAALPSWQPGAHVDLQMPSGLVRQYSLCGDPADRHSWRVGVLREAASRGGSAWVHDELRVGELIDVVGPRSSFPLVPSPRYLFLGGGIGITPLIPMIAAAQAAGADWRLVYGGRTRSSMAFTEDLVPHGDRITLWPQDECGLMELDDLLSEARTDTLVYCCGPEPLLSAVEKRCTGWPEGSLHVERFAAAPVADRRRDSAFEVELARSDRTVQVPVGTSIVEALEDAGVYPDVSCMEGICGTCETSVIEGEPDHRDSILTAEERLTGTSMFICVSRAKNHRLRLDL